MNNPQLPALSRLLTEARISRRGLVKGTVLGAAALLVKRMGLSNAYAAAGPSTTVDPYLLPSVSNVSITSLITVGDKAASNGYRMVGIPDGIGLWANDANTFSVMMNHELVQNVGTTRSHGSKGAFVSRWTVDRKTLRVLDGADHTATAAQLYSWDAAGGKYVPGTTAWSRFCSGDLAKDSAYFFNGKGTTDKIYLNGEETQDGRGWAHIATGAYAGTSWQLPRMGKSSWENLVASPYPQAKTVVIGLDDSNVSTAQTPGNYPSELFIYIGNKQVDGSTIDQAGLTNGKLYTIRVKLGPTIVTGESNDGGLGGSASAYAGSGAFELIKLGNDGDVTKMTPLQIEENIIAQNGFLMQRIEDGAWDPRPGKQNDFYFVTTASFSTNSRLWRLRFDDVTDPMKGGRIDIMVKGNEGHKMFDNVTIDGLGRIFLDEDPGNEGHIAKIWMYSIDSGKLTMVATHNPRIFDASFKAPEFLTQDEESTGIVDAADVLGQGWFLVNVQVHKTNTDVELVEYGQLMAMYVDPSVR